MHGGITPTRENPAAPLGRVLVLTGSIGSGHTRAAMAVREATLRSRAADTAEVVDVLEHATPAFRALYRDAYIALIERAPGMVGWLYRSSDTTQGGEARRRIQRIALARMRRLIAEERPDTIVCTHFLASELVSGMVERGEWRGTLAVVVTDLDAHAMWAVCPQADRWFVAMDETTEILVGKGVPRERIVVTGIPILGAFAAPLPSRDSIRDALGLPVAGPMLLVSGGGVGVSNLAGTLRQILDIDRPCCATLVCGRNEALRRQAEAIVSADGGRSRVRCAVLGFTDRMHELMHAADLALGKPGGLTSSEALASGLPMAIMHPVPGQEERNSDHLLEWGVAVRLNSPETVGWRLRTLLGDHARLRAMREAALRRARPLAADAVVENLRRLRLGEPAGGSAMQITQGRTRSGKAGRATRPPASR